MKNMKDHVWVFYIYIKFIFAFFFFFFLHLSGCSGPDPGPAGPGPAPRGPRPAPVRLQLPADNGWPAQHQVEHPQGGTLQNPVQPPHGAAAARWAGDPPGWSLRGRRGQQDGQTVRVGGNPGGGSGPGGRGGSRQTTEEGEEEFKFKYFNYFTRDEAWTVIVKICWIKHTHEGYGYVCIC